MPADPTFDLLAQHGDATSRLLYRLGDLNRRLIAVEQAKPAAGDWTKLATGSGSGASSIAFASISQAYKHLVLVIEGQSNKAGVNVCAMTMRINGITSNYNYAWARNRGGVLTSPWSLAAADIWWYLGDCPANNRANDNYISHLEVWLPHYSDTNIVKNFRSKFYGHDGTNQIVGESQGTWNGGVAAISSIAIFDDAAGTLGPRSFASLYGVS